jgi:hypothetical protein
MTLAELIVDVVKDVVKDGNTSLTAANLIAGDFDNDPQYLDLILASVPSINRAISRLVVHKKIPFKYFDVAYQPDLNGVPQQLYDLTTKPTYTAISNTIYSVVNIIHKDDTNRLQVVPYQTINKTLYQLPRADEGVFRFQYAPKLPRFKYVPGIYNNDLSLDLETYGVDDLMCEFITLYVRADLWEVEQPQLAQTYRELGEKYFEEFESQTITFRQERVDTVMGI